VHFENLRRRALRLAGLATLAASFALLPAAATGCSGGGDSTTGPSSSTNLCAEASFDSQANIGFNLGCNTISVSVSGITYDQFSRKKSYNYDISCAGGANRKSGSVSNITYNNLGQPLTWSFTVNGTSCSKS
jgi:hypothetical protein